MPMITIWHIFSVICLIAATASASGAATAEHTGTLAHTACILAGINFGLVAAFGNYSTSALASRKVEGVSRTTKIGILAVTLLASMGWVVLADLSGRWMTIPVLRILIHR
jgi:hypothetical protein